MCRELDPMEEVQLQLTVITLISNKSSKCLHRMHRYSVLNNSCSIHSITRHMVVMSPTGEREGQQVQGHD